MADAPEFAEVRIRQRLIFFLIGTLVAVIALTGFAIAAALEGELLAPDAALAALLVLGYVYVRITKRLMAASVVGVSAFMVFILAHVFEGGVDGSGALVSFAFPPAAMYLLGRRLGLAFSLTVASPMLVFLLLRSAGVAVAEHYTTQYLVRFAVAYLGATLLFYVVESQRTQAQAEVATLSGLLPICARCKNIRDDEGRWTQIEGYIQDRSDTSFSHSICPDCAKELYPEIDLSDA